MEEIPIWYAMQIIFSLKPNNKNRKTIEMKIYHMTTSTLQSELHRVKTYQDSCDDHDHWLQYQEEIDALQDALRCGVGCSFGFGYSKYVMDTRNFTEEL